MIASTRTAADPSDDAIETELAGLEQRLGMLIAHAKVLLSSDGMEAVVPRSAFSGLDGRLNFRVVAYANLDGGRRTWVCEIIEQSVGNG